MRTWGRRVNRFGESRTLRRLLRNGPAVIAFAFIVVLVVVALLSPLLMPYDPERQSLLDHRQGPSADHWLGTDSLGRDNLSRLLEGTGVTLYAISQAVGVAVVLGIPIGLLAGSIGGKLDGAFNFVSDVLLALPPLFLALGIVGILGPGLTNAMIALGIAFSPRFFRVARAAAHSVVNEAYVEATRALGCSTPRILFRHVLPNSSGPLLVQVTFTLGIAIVAEASLSFLGLGARPPTASWGSMLRDGYNNIYTSGFALIAPSVMIVLTIFASSILGDALRDALGRQTRVGD